MARVLKGFHSFICTPIYTYISNRNEPYLPLPSQPHSWYSFTDPEGWKAEQTLRDKSNC